MNSRYNQWFEQTAADPLRRRVAIADFTRRRAIHIGCALFITVCAIFLCFTTTHNRIAPYLEIFAAFMSWIPAIKIGSDLRTLRLLDHFSTRDEKPMA